MALPELPRTLLDTTMPNTAGYVTKTVGASGKDFTSINTAVNHTSVKDATTGIILSITAGETFTETVTLPVHTNPWVIIQSSLTSSLPAGTRVQPRDTPKMAKVIAGGSGVAFQCATSASKYRLIGLEVTYTAFTFGPIQVGALNETLDSQFPSFIYIDRCYIHPDPTAGGRRGIAMNGKSQAVIDSYVSDWKEVGSDSQAVGGWNGPGPYKIVNNYLEAAGENILFGGTDPSITNLVPSDIEVRRNHCFKPLTWKIGHPTYLGTAWTVKNIFELKNAQRVLAEGNLFENCWLHGQDGFGVLLTPRNQNNTAPWSVVQDVTFRHNIIRHCASAIDILGTDAPNTSQPVQRVWIYNNLFYDISQANWGGDGRILQLLLDVTGPTDLLYEHNTGTVDVTPLIMSGSTGSPAITYRYNNMAYGAIGIYGNNIGSDANASIAAYIPGSSFTQNLFFNNTGQSWPPSNFPATSTFAATTAAVGFTDVVMNNYRLLSSSPYYQVGPGGSDLGVDMGQLWQGFGLETRRSAVYGGA